MAEVYKTHDERVAQLGLFPDDALPKRAAGLGAAPIDERHLTIAERLASSVRLGTSSWSFPGWAGLVYDRRVSEETLAREGLAAYARHPLLRTVSIDRSFYRPLDAAQYRAYAAAVPKDFRFVVKADRLLTSPSDPDARSGRAANVHFLDARYATSEVIGPTVEGLGRTLGVLVFQFPPLSTHQVGGRGAFLDRLQAFLAALPQTCRYAVELRTPQLLTEEYADLLEATAVAHCYNVHPAMAPLARQLEVVRPFQQPMLLVRWMLGRGQVYAAAKARYEPFDRLVDEDPATRNLVARTVLDASLAERDAFVIANNKAEGSAPRTVFALADRIANWTS